MYLAWKTLVGILFLVFASSFLRTFLNYLRFRRSSALITRPTSPRFSPIPSKNSPLDQIALFFEQDSFFHVSCLSCVRGTTKILSFSTDNELGWPRVLTGRQSSISTPRRFNPGSESRSRSLLDELVHGQRQKKRAVPPEAKYGWGGRKSRAASGVQCPMR